MASGGKWSRIFATHSQVIPYPENTNDHSARSLSGSQQLAFRRPLLWKTTLVLRREEFCGTDLRKNTSKSFITLRISVTVELCFSLIDLSYNKFYSWFLARARLVSLRKNFRFDASFSLIFLLNNYFSFHLPITAGRSVMFLGVNRDSRAERNESYLFSNQLEYFQQKPYIVIIFSTKQTFH